MQLAKAAKTPDKRYRQNAASGLFDAAICVFLQGLEDI